MVVEVPDHLAELAADRLWAHEPAAIEEQGGSGRTVLLAGYPDRDAAGRAAASVGMLSDGVVRVVPVDDDGLDGWRPWATVERAGPFHLVPTWLDAPIPAAGEHVLWLDPAHTFGSGSHPTTRLVLARAAELLAERGSTGRADDAVVLDVGTGSGVLAIGAVLAGAARAEAIDVDPGSPAAVAANAERNGVADRIRADGRTLSEVGATGARYPLVLANLLAPVVVELAADLAGVLAPDGALVVSGLLADRWEATTSALTGLALAHLDEADGWVAVTLIQAPRVQASAG